jgi:hypothetical protein
MTAEPDPRTAADDNEDATNEGRSSQSPAEGSDQSPPPGIDSPERADADIGPGTSGG